MDNTKYYNDSLAYDYDMFLTGTARKEKRDATVIKIESPKAKKRKKAAVQKLSVSAFSIMFATFMLFALCGNLFLRLQINEINSKINAVKSEINALDSEKTSLEVELERKMSFANIELEATELGMRKMSKEQVEYIRVNEKNSAITSDGEVIEAD